MTKYAKYTDARIRKTLETIQRGINGDLERAGELGIQLASFLSNPHNLPRGRQVGELITDITEQVDELMKGVVSLEHSYAGIRAEANKRNIHHCHMRGLDCRHRYTEYDQTGKVWA